MEQIFEGNILFKTYYNDVFRACYYMVKNSHDAEDLCQDVFAKALCEEFYKIENQKSWLLSIAMNMSRNYLKKKRRTSLIGKIQSLSFKLIDDSQNIEDEILQRESTSMFAEIMNQLPVHIRMVMIFKYVYEFKDKEIAEVLKIPIGTVKSRNFKGKKIVKQFTHLNETKILKWGDIVE